MCMSSANIGSGLSVKNTEIPVLPQPPLPDESPKSQPPLPDEPLNSRSQSYDQAQTSYTYNCNAGWKPDGFNVDIPPISSLLIREADAWRALLNLHPSVVSGTQQIARSLGNSSDTYIKLAEDSQLTSDCRESAYCSALSSLAAQCDSLFTEIMKIRAFRKTKRNVEVACVNEILRAHASEILAMGQTLASNGSLSVSSATSELRIAIQAQRNHITLLRQFLDVVKAFPTTIPTSSKLAVCARNENNVITHIHNLDDIMEELSSTSQEITNSSVSKALSRMFDTKTSANNKNFVRRSVDRDVAVRSEELKS